MRIGVILLAALLSVPASAKTYRQIIGVETDHSVAQVGDCDDFFNTVFTAFPESVTAQDEREIPLTGVSTLKVTATQEGGVSVRGWNKPFAKLIVCRSAVAEKKGHARRVLEAIKVTHANGEINAAGPAIDLAQAWWVNFIVYAPKKATVDVRSANGGVAIRNMDGNVIAHATKGGVSVAQSSGSYKIFTETGGITLDRISGRVEASSRDGAIALKLAADDVPVIEAKTEATGEILCHLAGCNSGLGTWTPDRKQLRIGGAPALIRLSTAGSDIIIDRVR